MSVGEHKPDGQYDSKVDKYDCVETVDTKLAEDGVEETHISYEVKQASQWTFGPLGSRYTKNYGKINWGE